MKHLFLMYYITVFHLCFILYDTVRNFILGLVLEEPAGKDFLEADYTYDLFITGDTIFVPRFFTKRVYKYRLEQ